MNFLSSSSVRSLLRASPSLQLHSTSRRLTSQPQLQPAPSLLNVNIKTSDVSAQPPLSVNPNPSPPLYTSAGGIITCKCTLDPKLHPKRPNRILLIRHGESRVKKLLAFLFHPHPLTHKMSGFSPASYFQGNVDENLYATVPDNQMPLSDKGHIQARAAGLQLKSIVGDETVKFYVSPYVRTRQTFMELNKALDPKQWTYREEPRLREQDFGNFQNLEKINRCRQERRLFGAFYYRFPQVSCRPLYSIWLANTQ